MNNIRLMARHNPAREMSVKLYIDVNHGGAMIKGYQMVLFENYRVKEHSRLPSVPNTRYGFGMIQNVLFQLSRLYPSFIRLFKI